MENEMSKYKIEKTQLCANGKLLVTIYEEIEQNWMFCGTYTIPAKTAKKRRLEVAVSKMNECGGEYES
jgi:hypothetical protein